MPSINVTRFWLFITFSVVAILLASSPAYCESNSSTRYLQGYIGAAKFDEDSLTFLEASDTEPETVSTSDLSSMPFIGVAGQFAFSPGQTHFGIDTSLLFGWRSDDTTVTAGNGRARVKIDSSLWLVDLAVGLYGQTVLADRWRIYGAAGPVLLFGEYSDDTKNEDLTVAPLEETEESNSDSAFGAGGYAKLGIEYAISNDSYVGIAVRGVASNLDFDRALDDDGLTGGQAFVTFTRAY